MAKVIHNFGRADQVDRAALARLVSSTSGFLEPELAVAATRWVSQRVVIEDCAGFDADAAHAAMDFLLDALDEIAAEACVRPEPVMMLPRTAADVLAEHVVFEVEPIERLYLNVYVPELLVGFLTRHRGFEIVSTALVAPMSKDFVAGIDRYAADHGLPLIDFVADGGIAQLPDRAGNKRIRAGVPKDGRSPTKPGAATTAEPTTSASCGRRTPHRSSGPSGPTAPDTAHHPRSLSSRKQPGRSSPLSAERRKARLP